MKPKLLDLFCCQGGAGMGYHKAGFKVIGVDIEPQPRNPFDFRQGNAISLLKTLRAGGSFNTGSSSPLYTLDDFDAIHASPPCQAFTNAQKLMGNEHPDFIEPTRELLNLIGLPYVIENVPGAPLESPFELCGSMFGLGTYRHRLFETNFDVDVPEHPKHEHRTTKMGRKPIDGEMMHVVGNFSGVAKAKIAMGIDWMNRDGLRESIPPAYTEYIGRDLMEEVMARKDIAA
jgi:DNA (cytosine-5)-methyltransferase 1